MMGEIKGFYKYFWFCKQISLKILFILKKTSTSILHILRAIQGHFQEFQGMQLLISPYLNIYSR